MINLDSSVGILMHLISSIDRIKLGQYIEKNIDTKEILKEREEDLKKVKKILEPIEKKCCMKFYDDEIYYLYTLITKI